MRVALISGKPPATAAPTPAHRVERENLGQYGAALGRIIQDALLFTTDMGRNRRECGRQRQEPHGEFDGVAECGA
jgi:hypothetical protein